MKELERVALRVLLGKVITFPDGTRMRIREEEVRRFVRKVERLHRRKWD